MDPVSLAQEQVYFLTFKLTFIPLCYFLQEEEKLQQKQVPVWIKPALAWSYL